MLDVGCWVDTYASWIVSYRHSGRHQEGEHPGAFDFSFVADLIRPHVDPLDDGTDLGVSRIEPPWNGRSGIRTSGYGALRARANQESSRSVAPVHGDMIPLSKGITVIHNIHRVDRVAVPSWSYERSQRAASTVIAPIARTSV